MHIIVLGNKGTTHVTGTHKTTKSIPKANSQRPFLSFLVQSPSFPGYSASLCSAFVAWSHVRTPLTLRSNPWQWALKGRHHARNGIRLCNSQKANKYFSLRKHTHSPIFKIKARTTAFAWSITATAPERKYKDHCQRALHQTRKPTLGPKLTRFNPEMEIKTPPDHHTCI